MKRFFPILICLSLIAFLGYSQVTVKLGSVENAEPGTYVNVPLIVTGLSETGQAFIGIEALFNFQENIISFDSLANGHPLTPVTQWYAGSIIGKVSANWLDPNLNPINVADNSVLVEFVFFYSGGQTYLNFDQAGTIIYDQNANTLVINSFINGSISQAQGSDNSIWNGTDTWTVNNNWSNGIPGDSTNAIIQSGIVTLTSGGNCRDLKINSGARLVISSGSSLTVNGDLDNEGEILVESDSIIQGSLIVKGSVIRSGQFAMAMDMYQNVDFRFSCPVKNVQAGLFSPAIVRAYSESAGIWEDLPGSMALQTGIGYGLTPEIEGEILLSGEFVSEQVTLNLSRTVMEDPVIQGLNLVGNPFTSSFSSDTYLIKNNADRAIYAWDGNGYKVWNGIAGNIPGGIIPPFSAIFVKANSNQASVTFERSGQVHDFSHYNTVFNNADNVLEINLTNFNSNAPEDVTFLQIEPGSTYSYDGQFDAYKLQNPMATAELYLTGKGGEKYAIEALPEAIEADLGIHATGNGTYTISAITANFMPGIPIYLLDNELQIVRDLRSENYVFNIMAGDYPTRFVIVLTGIGFQEYDSVFKPLVFTFEDIILIKTDKEYGKSLIGIYDASGRLCGSEEKNLTPGEIHRIKGISGMNIVVIRTDTGIYSYKLFLK